MDEANLTLAAVTVTWAHVAGLLAAVPACYFGWQGLKRGRAADLAAANAGVAVTQTVTTGQVLDSLDELVQRLQEDRRDLRAALEQANTKLDEQGRLIDALRLEVAALRRSNGSGGITGAPLN